MGITYKGFKKKTEQSKAEARHRGNTVSDNNEPSKMKKKGKKASGKGETSDAWKKPKKIKIEVEHKTYEQIVAETGQELPLLPP
ncbi:hypothetical protein NLI96_g11951 [Meripilus lineatus]|uniref:Uncharacterized protein n=1 Tax=Meripilus lineatus TaxID=2056292 RepID=A0AAD5UQT6_9APHY|nr:hypothetical protein NLI96_g11951 [Physisporinus lineatus]